MRPRSAGRHTACLLLPAHHTTHSILPGQSERRLWMMVWMVDSAIGSPPSALLSCCAAKQSPTWRRRPTASPAEDWRAGPNAPPPPPAITPLPPRSLPILSFFLIISYFLPPPPVAYAQWARAQQLSHGTGKQRCQRQLPILSSLSFTSPPHSFLPSHMRSGRGRSSSRVSSNGVVKGEWRRQRRLPILSSLLSYLLPPVASAQWARAQQLARRRPTA